MHFRKPSPGTAIALLALFFAMGGTAIAAHHYLITSTKQIKPSVLKALKGNAGPKGATGLKGENGLKGEKGEKGETGPAGPVKLSTLSQIRGTEKEVEPGFDGVSRAKCPPGTRVVTGGSRIESEKVAPNFEESKAMGELKGWEVEIGDPFGSGENIVVEAIAYCAGEGEAVTG